MVSPPINVRTFPPIDVGGGALPPVTAIPGIVLPPAAVRPLPFCVTFCDKAFPLIT